MIAQGCHKTYVLWQLTVLRPIKTSSHVGDNVTSPQGLHQYILIHLATAHRHLLNIACRALAHCLCPDPPPLGSPPERHELCPIIRAPSHLRQTPEMQTPLGILRMADLASLPSPGPTPAFASIHPRFHLSCRRCDIPVPKPECCDVWPWTNSRRGRFVSSDAALPAAIYGAQQASLRHRADVACGFGG